MHNVNSELSSQLVLRYQRYLRDNQVVQSWQGTANILKCFVAVTGAIHLSEVRLDTNMESNDCL